MRRSKAPSVLKKAKYLCTAESLETENHCLEPVDEDYKWGSGSKSQYGEINNENKRIFNVVWRDVSTKKHKTWKGDGTLEVNVSCSKAILKDENGTYLGCLTKPINDKLGPDVQMIVGNKEIEIQDEIMDVKESLQLRKIQVQNRNWGEEDWMSSEDLKEEQKKPKGGFKFKPLLVLKSPQTPTSIANFSEHSKQPKNEKSIVPAKILLTTTTCNNLPKNILCFIRPSELQQLLFQKVLDYYESVKSSLASEIIESLDIPQILQHICNHPSFINRSPSANELICQLIPILPDWSEMGPFDSGKLEFVQFFLKDLLKDSRQNCTILAKNTNTSNMLQGLCDFMHLKCLRLHSCLSEDNQQKVLNAFSSNYNNSIRVLLINSFDLLRNIKDQITTPQNLIVFDDFSLDIENVNIKNCSVYYLVTAFSIEELLLLNNNKNTDKEILQELTNLPTPTENCYLHTKIQCKCLDLKLDNESATSGAYKSHTFIANWKHLTNPFDELFLKSVNLENCAENIVTIFYKNN